MCSHPPTTRLEEQLPCRTRGIVSFIPSLDSPRLVVVKKMSQNIPRDAWSEQEYLPAQTRPQPRRQDSPHLMLVISFLMESETVRE